jgi:hypothetical protein
MGFVQANSGFSAGPITLTGVDGESTLVAYVQGNSTMASTTLPAPWQKLTMATEAGGGVDLWGCLWVLDKNDHAGGSISAAITTAPSTPAWAIAEYSGRDASAIDVQGNNTGVGTTWTSANLSVSEGADVVVGCGQMATGFTIAFDSPYARRTGQDGHVLALGDDVDVAAGSTSGTGAVSTNSDGWVACAVALKKGPPIPVQFGAIGAKTITGTTTVSIAHPTGTAADNILLAGRVGWYSDIALSDEAGWTNTIRQAGGNNGAVADNHTTEVGVDRKEISGADAGPTVFDQVGGTQPGIVGIMARYVKLAGYTWDVAAAAGTDDTHGANRSVTASTSIALAVGDVVVAVAAVGTDASLTITAPAITASGITFGATTQRAPVSAGSIQGHDGNIYWFDATVTAGSGTVAPVLAFTTATSQSGPVGFVRLRAVAPAARPIIPTMQPRKAA